MEVTTIIGSALLVISGFYMGSKLKSWEVAFISILMMLGARLIWI